jgi:RHS repeat-associated protein
LEQLILEKGEIEHKYSYDSIGNRLRKDRSMYTVSEVNQLIEAGRVAYTFDQNGNLSSKTIDAKTWVYQSNPLNQIISITDPDQNVIKFTYDPSGKRLTKRIESKGKKPKVFRFFYLGNTEIGSVDEKGAIIELKIPSNPNNPETPSIAIEIRKEIYVPLYDLQGNIVCLLDPQKRKIMESYYYSAYGEEEIVNAKNTVIAESYVGNPWRYRGKRIDQETALIYFGYRYYDPKVGRWISPDPAGILDGPNLYAYAHNNPMKYVDYFGLSSDMNSSQICQCGYCERQEGFCHCLEHIDYSECGCRGILCAHKTDRRMIPGSDIPRAICGASHGVVDYVIHSLHDLQIAAAYTGSAELDISFQERAQIIKTVEQSQANRFSQVEHWIMDLFSVDASDPVYHSFRSGAILTLDLGSLAIGGYGLVKVGMTFHKLADMSGKVTKIANQVKKPHLEKLNHTVKAIEGFLEGKGQIITNTDGDMILIKGNKKIRFDIKDPHGDLPHFHLEKMNANGKWVNAGFEHRYYFMEE